MRGLSVEVAGDMKIDVVVASISCLGKFPTNHCELHPSRSNYNYRLYSVYSTALYTTVQYRRLRENTRLAS